MATTTTPIAPTTPTTVGTGTSSFAQSYSAANPNNSPYFLPTHTDTTYLTQTSQPDIEAQVNAVMQQLTGRFATQEEISKYGAELLAAERANPGSFTGQTTYQVDSGKRNMVTGEQLTAGVSPVDFLTNLIRGTGEARDYQAATGYMDAMQQSNNKFRSAFSG